MFWYQPIMLWPNLLRTRQALNFFLKKIYIYTMHIFVYIFTLRYVYEGLSNLLFNTISICKLRIYHKTCQLTDPDYIPLQKMTISALKAPKKSFLNFSHYSLPLCDSCWSVWNMTQRLRIRFIIFNIAPSKALKIWKNGPYADSISENFQEELAYHQMGGISQF